MFLKMEHDSTCVLLCYFPPSPASLLAVRTCFSSAMQQGHAMGGNQVCVRRHLSFCCCTTQNMEATRSAVVENLPLGGRKTGEILCESR